jgi:hypothetical protein
MNTELQDLTPELLFLKYKGVPSPWEITGQSKNFGFKCKRYSKWPDVHVSENSRQLLTSVGDSLIDSEEFEISEYGEISRIWERVQRWAKDKEGFSIEPDVLPEYEKLLRLLNVGAVKPDVVDLMIDEFGYASEALSIEDRWLVFLTICIHNLFHSSKRYELLLEAQKSHDISVLKFQDLLITISNAIVELYLQIGFDVSANEEADVIKLFIKELGCNSVPIVIERSAAGKLKSLPKVWIEHYEGGLSELVKFQYSDGQVIVKLNKSNKFYKSDSSLSKALIEDDFWNLIGNSLHSHINQIDDIQDFFDTFAKQLRLRG